MKKMVPIVESTRNKFGLFCPVCGRGDNLEMTVNRTATILALTSTGIEIVDEVPSEQVKHNLFEPQVNEDILCHTEDCHFLGTVADCIKA